MIELRDNQIEPVRKGVEFFEQKKSTPSLIVCPTAFGKSIVISKIANDTGDKMLALQPSKELLEQNLAKLRLLGGDASVYSASMNTKEIGHITYGTVGSIKNIGHKFDGYKLVVDEADRYPKGSSGMLRKFIKEAKIKHTLGLTATPFKLETYGGAFDNYSVLKMLTTRSKKGSFFKEIIHVCQISEMVEKGYWSPIVYETYDFNTKELVFNSTKAEFTELSIKEAYIKQNIEQKIIDKIKESDRKSILVFVPSVDDAIKLAAKTPNSAAVWGTMPKDERADILEKFKCLDLKIVINVNVLSVGFDHPELDMIISGRTTASLSWWYQAIGRGTRIHFNKKDILVVDFAGNTPRFGKIEDLLYVQETDGWKLYGENGNLLTGVPIDEIGKHNKNTEETRLLQKFNENEAEQEIKFEGIIKFGKFKDKKVEDTPLWWREWMLKEFKFDSKTIYIKEKILELK